MKIVIAIDSFKGSVSSDEAGNAVKSGILRVFPDADISVYPVADGGEGTVKALVTGLNGQYRRITVCDPLRRNITAEYGILPDNTAVIEMAAASGLTLLTREELNPMITTTFGTGQMIKDAIEHGCRKFIIGIGGSATNDGGTGCLRALGFSLYDKKGNPVSDGAAGCSEIYSVSSENAVPELAECTFHVACDVKNPLCGENGCSAVFAPQKGADSSMIKQMDEFLKNFADKTVQFNHAANPDTPGAGAAGGLGFALLSYMNACLESGTELVIRETGLEKAVVDADLVITGEGCLDSQTVMGKAPAGIASVAKKYGKPVIAFSGSVSPDAGVCNEYGIDAFFPALRRITTAEEAMDRKNTSDNLAAAAEQVFRVLALKHDYHCF